MLYKMEHATPLSLRSILAFATPRDKLRLRTVCPVMRDYCGDSWCSLLYDAICRDSAEYLAFLRDPNTVIERFARHMSRAMLFAPGKDLPRREAFIRYTIAYGEAMRCDGIPICINWNDAINYAYACNDKAVIRFIKTHFAAYHYYSTAAASFFYICMSGNRKRIDKCIHQYRTRKIDLGPILNHGMAGACTGRHMELAFWLGEQAIACQAEVDWLYLLPIVVQYRSVTALQGILDRIGNNERIRYGIGDISLSTATRHNFPEGIDLLIEKLKNVQYDSSKLWLSLLKGACESGRMDAIAQAMKYRSPNTDTDLTFWRRDLLVSACRSRKCEMVDFLFHDMHLTPTGPELLGAFIATLQTGQRDIIEKMFAYIPHDHMKFNHYMNDLDLPSLKVLVDILKKNSMKLVIKTGDPLHRFANDCSFDRAILIFRNARCQFTNNSRQLIADWLRLRGCSDVQICDWLSP